MKQNQSMVDSGIHDFDFLLVPYTIQNRRRTNAMYPDRDGVWEEFVAHHTAGNYLDGKVIIDHFEGTFPDGEVRKGMTIRAYDETNKTWSLVWLDNHNGPDFRPLVGRFENGIGTFFQVIETSSGQPLHVRFTWDQITEEQARWQQAFSFDEGKGWDTNWIMAFTRKG